MGQKGKHVTMPGNQAKLEQSGSRRKSRREPRVQEGAWGYAARGSFIWHPALSCVGGLASLKPGVMRDKQPPLCYCAWSQIILDFDHNKFSTLVYLFPDSAQ